MNESHFFGWVRPSRYGSAAKPRDRFVPRDIMSAPLRSRCSQPRGVTLLLTLLLVAVLAIVLAQNSLRVNTMRIAAAARAFSVESHWAAQGAAAQLLDEVQEPSIAWDQILLPRRWHVGDVAIDVKVLAAEHKLSVQTTDPHRWLALWRTQGQAASFVRDPHRAMIESGYTAIECLLEPTAVGARAAYVAPEGGRAVADVLTVWGDGKIDLNRAPREVLTAALERFTDAQVSGILRLRKEAPIDSLGTLARELSLSAGQQDTLMRVGAFHPRHLELLITVRRGQMQALYRGVIDAKAPVRVLELRAIQ